MKQTEQQRQIFQQAAGLVISAAEGKIWTAVIRRRGEGFERIHQAVFDLQDGLDSAVQQLRRQAGETPMSVVIGLDSSRLRFLEMTLPPADAAQLPFLIRTQAEAQLPLEGEQMQLAWRLSPAVQGYGCTVAAARLDATDSALSRLSLNGRLTAMVPEMAGFARLRRHYFAPTPEVCVVLRRRTDGFAMALLDGAALVQCSVVHADPSEAAQHPALVMQDILMELDAIEKKHGRKCPVYLWAQIDPFMREIEAKIRQTGWEVSILEADKAALQRAKIGADEDIYGPQLDAAGLAMLGLSETAPAFDFLQMRRMAQPLEDAKRRRKQRLRAIGYIVGLALLCAAVSFWSLKLQVRQLQQELASEVDELKAETLLQRQNYQEAVARARLDLLELFEALQISRDGLLLDSIEYEMGKPVKLIASAGSYEQVYGFQKRLLTQNGVSQVRLIDPRMDDRTKQVKFTMQFQYKHFTK
ncbi:MAG: hypothetical protein JXB18_05740 [Sedimentisphaerales bacterium]|nr:hypothetical protein [Sedimentisphaerales bacterium]